MFTWLCFCNLLLSFHTFSENLSFSWAFAAPLNIQGGSGGHLGLPVGPSGAMRRHQIVNISLVLHALLQIDIVMLLVIFYLSFHSCLKTDHSRQLL